MKRLFLILPLTLLTLLLFTTPVFAISSPDTISINNVYAYRNCIETGDQLYLIDFTIDYTSNPSENVEQAFIIRLLDETDAELGSTTPYAYYNDGYDRGIASIYFSASEAPTWSGAYSVEIVGNPTLSWTPSQPTAILSSWSVWQDNGVNYTQELISGRILYLAGELDSAWSASYSLLDYTVQGTYLSENGAEYFSGVIDNLDIIAPYSLSYRNVDLDYDRTDPMYDYTHDYVSDLDSVINGTVFDVTNASSLFGVGNKTLFGVLYYGVVLMGFMTFAPRLQSTKPLMVILIPISIAGAFIGGLLLAVIIGAFICLLMIGYALFYKNTAT